MSITTQDKLRAKLVQLKIDRIMRNRSLGFKMRLCAAIATDTRPGKFWNQQKVAGNKGKDANLI